MQKKFCVISVNAIERTWCETEQEAIEHAKAIMNKPHNRNSNRTFVVVEAKKVIASPRQYEIFDTDRLKDFI